MDRRARLNSRVARGRGDSRAFALVFAGCGAIVTDAVPARLARHGRHRAGLRAGDHGDGLRDRPPLRRAHQPGGDARLHAHPPLPGPRGARLRRRPARGRDAPRRSLLLARLDRQAGAPRARPSRASAPAARCSTRRADRLPDVRDHGRGHRHARGRRRRRDRDRRHGRPRRALRRPDHRRLDEPGPLVRPGARVGRAGTTSGSTSSARRRRRGSARSPTSSSAASSRSTARAT